MNKTINKEEGGNPLRELNSQYSQHTRIKTGHRATTMPDTRPTLEEKQPWALFAQRRGGLIVVMR